MKTLSLKPFHLASVQHASAHLVGFIPDGTFLTVTHTPENKYDPFALAVTLNDTMLGHIPRTDQACWFYHAIANDIVVLLRVVKHDRDQPPYKQIEVEFVCDPAYNANVSQVVK